MNRTLDIDIYFDFICPWCWIGKRQLEQAIERLALSHPEVAVRRHWRGVQLLPQLPPAGVPYREFYLARLGGEAALRQRQAQVVAAARLVDLRLELEAIPRMPNTALAHQLFRRGSAHATPQARLETLLERLFAAHFCRRENLGDAALLLRWAKECGVNADTLAGCLQQTDSGSVDSAAAVTSVPSYVIDSRGLITGAQPAEVLYRGMLAALAGGEAA